MYKILLLLSLTFLFNGCVESIALLGSSVGVASSGKILQSSINSTISYGVKKQTGKTPLGHALAYAEEKNPEKIKDTCVSFIEKTRSEFCTILKKKITSTNTSIKEKTQAVVKKYPEILNVVNKKKFVKPNDVVKVEENNFFNGFTQFNNSPRKLAIAFQAKMKEITKNNNLKQYLIGR